jgi:glycosyltransferase involved in cell wall biosynthesis
MWRRRATFDVVHVHQYSWASLFVIVLAKLMGKSVLAKLANVGDFGLPSIRRGLLGPVKQAIFLSSDSIVAMSRESLAELEEVGYPAGRVLSTPNGIPLDFSTQAQHPEGRPCQVVFVGRLDEQKRLDVLLGAWADICGSKPEAHLHIWGQGPLDAELRQQAARLKIEGNLTFGGQVEGVPKRLAEMDVFVLPSQAEGNSNALLEAMAAGLPIVSTSVGGTAMQVGVEGQAFLCGPGDGEALKAALTRLISSPPLRRSLGAAMRRRAEEHFDIEKVAATYASAYQRLISRRRETVSLVSNAIIGTGGD